MLLPARRPPRRRAGRSLGRGSTEGKGGAAARLPARGARRSLGAESDTSGGSSIVEDRRMRAEVEPERPADQARKHRSAPFARGRGAAKSSPTVLRNGISLVWWELAS